MLIGGWLVVIGVQSWLDQRAAMAVVNGFLHAVEEGDRETALSFLEASRRDEIAPGLSDPDSPVWLPTPGVQHRINEFAIDGDTAAAKVWIEKDSFLLEPVIRLQRVETGSWKIVEIEQLTIDPKWEQLVKQRAQNADQETNRELQDALNGRAGTSITRAPLPGSAPDEPAKRE